MAIITFTDLIGVPKEYEPVLSSQLLPDWYKNTPSYFSNEKKPDENAKSTATIKRCIPVFDSLTAGYLILTHVDLYVSQRNVITSEENSTDFKSRKEQIQPWYSWPAYSPIEFHNMQQLPNHPYNTGHTLAAPKWMNPWSIKTQPGYSVLFLPPMHHPSMLSILPGIVDTDKYNNLVNFPFVLKDITFEGLIPAGTPIAQIIPFKRESWKKTIQTTDELAQKSFKDNLLVTSKFFDGYKKFFWQKKEYK
jgi:hypothetical protein